jgi:hypothetical protein
MEITGTLGRSEAGGGTEAAEVETQRGLEERRGAVRFARL